MHEKTALPILVFGGSKFYFSAPQAMISRETVISGNREILVTVVLRKRQVDNPP